VLRVAEPPRKSGPHTDLCPPWAYAPQLKGPGVARHAGANDRRATRNPNLHFAPRRTPSRLPTKSMRAMIEPRSSRNPRLCSPPNASRPPTKVEARKAPTAPVPPISTLFPNRTPPASQTKSKRAKSENAPAQPHFPNSRRNFLRKCNRIAPFQQ